MMKFMSILLSLLMAQSVFAKRFTSQYCEFELPPAWECALEGTEWVCQSQKKRRKREAIIILAAKIRGGQDSLSSYQGYLNKKKTFTLPGGKTQVSEPKYTNLRSINDHRWVDSLHLASEVPGFYTRYLATVKEDLGVAVTFSVAKDHYESYQAIFDRVIATLRVFRQKQKVDYNLAKGSENVDVLDSMGGIPDSGKNINVGLQKGKRKGKGMGATEAGVGLLLLAGAGYAVYNMKRKKKGSGSKKKKKKKKS